MRTRFIAPALKKYLVIVSLLVFAAACSDKTVGPVVDKHSNEPSAMTATTVKIDTKKVNLLKFSFTHPKETLDYSVFTLEIDSNRPVLKIEISGGDMLAIEVNQNSVQILSPIVNRNREITFDITVTSIDRQSVTKNTSMKVKTYNHKSDTYRELSPRNIDKHRTKDYAVFNFGFDSIQTNEPYTETLCYPKPTDCSENDGTFTSDMHNSQTGDFNGDGWEDLVVSWAVFPHTLVSEKTQSTVQIYLNDGTGRLFKDNTIYENGAPPSRHMAYRLVVADFNNDGIDDIFSGSMSLLQRIPGGGFIKEHEPHVLLLSNPSGSMTDASNLIENRFENFAHDASAGDINQDGYIDIFAGRQLFLNQAGKAFSDISENLPDQWRHNWQKYSYLMSSLVNDFNSDGFDDVIAFWADNESSQDAPHAEILLSDGTDRIGNWKIQTLPEGFFGHGRTKFNYAVASDIDYDGDLDIALASTRANPYYVGRHIQLLINDGQGNFIDESLNRFGYQNRAENHQDPLIDSDCEQHGEGVLYVRDMNNDGYVDLVDQAASYPKVGMCPGVTVYLNDGLGFFEEDIQSELSWVSGAQIATYDSNFWLAVRNPTQIEIQRAIPIDLDKKNNIDFVSQVFAGSFENVRFLYEIISLSQNLIDD
tara:strand:- start:26 stop:1969 length:1944 start_codon:yes stop_codon:yes gene_type:complete